MKIIVDARIVKFPMKREPGCTCTEATDPRILSMLAKARENGWPDAYALQAPPEGCPAHPGECGHRWTVARSRWAWKNRRRNFSGSHVCFLSHAHDVHQCCCGAEIAKEAA